MDSPVLKKISCPIVMNQNFIYYVIFKKNKLCLQIAHDSEVSMQEDFKNELTFLAVFYSPSNQNAQHYIYNEWTLRKVMGDRGSVIF